MGFCVTTDIRNVGQVIYTFFLCSLFSNGNTSATLTAADLWKICMLKLMAMP